MEKIKNVGIEMHATMLSEDQLAVKWNISVKTLQAWRRKKCGPLYCKFGRCVRYPMQHVQEFEAKKLRESTYD